MRDVRARSERQTTPAGGKWPEGGRDFKDAGSWETVLVRVKSAAFWRGQKRNSRASSPPRIGPADQRSNQGAGWIGGN